MTALWISAGDASGDATAADLARALRARFPTLRLLGLGGVEMEKAGVEIVVHQRELAVGGLFELLPDLRRIASAWRRLSGTLEEASPELVVLVDSPGFHLPFARRVRRRGIPCLYYVAPQVWAWRRRRMGKLARRVDRLAVIFPFEAELWRGTGVRVEFVGHPLVDRLRAPGLTRAGARSALGLDPQAPLVALLPGSRRSELRHTLALYLAVARTLHARDGRLQFSLPLAAGIEREAMEARVRAECLPSRLRLDLLEGRSLEALCACDVALVKPGTATLEAALLARPLVVAARSHPLTAALARRVVRVRWLALPNLMAGREVVPEYLQRDADPERIAGAVLERLAGPARDAQLAELAALRERLGDGEAARRTAEIAEEMILARRRP